MKRLLILAGLMIATCAVLAEVRDPNSPTTPERLREISSLVFEGTVVAIETNTEHKLVFPTKATVGTVVKGKLSAKELTFKHKTPGKFIIIEKEYNTPAVGQTGIFYLQDQSGTLILIGYIKKTEQPSAGDALKGAPQIPQPKRPDIGQEPRTKPKTLINEKNILRFGGNSCKVRVKPSDILGKIAWKYDPGKEMKELQRQIAAKKAKIKDKRSENQTSNLERKLIIWAKKGNQP